MNTLHSCSKISARETWTSERSWGSCSPGAYRPRPSLNSRTCCRRCPRKRRPNIIDSLRSPALTLAAFQAQLVQQLPPEQQARAPALWRPFLTSEARAVQALGGMLKELEKMQPDDAATLLQVNDMIM